VADQSKRAARQRKEERRYERLRPQIDALYDDLHHHYPQTFCRDPEQMHPLKVGIARDLRAHVEVSSRVLNYCLERYTTQPAYLRALVAQKPRLDLSGQAVGTVSEDERANAQRRLDWREKKRRPQASRGRQAAEQPIPLEARHTPRADARTPELSPSPPVHHESTPFPAAAPPPPRRLPATWQRILAHLSVADGPQRPVDIGAALGMNHPGSMLRRMRDRGLVRQIQRGLYEIAREPTQNHASMDSGDD
jgi:sRNA-binding protein